MSDVKKEEIVCSLTEGRSTITPDKSNFESSENSRGEQLHL